jgi:hypothetical protein
MNRGLDSAEHFVLTREHRHLVPAALQNLEQAAVQVATDPFIGAKERLQRRGREARMAEEMAPPRTRIGQLTQGRRDEAAIDFCIEDVTPHALGHHHDQVHRLGR